MVTPEQKATSSDPGLLDWLRPPYPVERFGWRQWIAGPILILICAPLLLLMTVGYFGFDREGRGLIVDTALALGLGAPLAGVQADVTQCDSYGSYRRFGTYGFDCEIIVTRVTDDGFIERRALQVDVGQEADASRFTGAGRFLGAVGLYWPVGELLGCWWQSMLIFVGIAVVGSAMWFPLALLRADRALGRAARQGAILPADLLYPHRSGRWFFAYRDRRGRQCFARARFAGGALLMDAVITKGAALVAPNGRAWLVMKGLHPPKVTEADVVRALKESNDRYVAPRAAAAPLAGEPVEPAARLAAIAALVGTSASAAQLTQAYILAWRLVWDGSDAEIAPKAFAFRNQAGARLGPTRTLAALEDCRRRFVRDPAG